MNLFESLIAALKADAGLIALVGARIYPMRADEDLTPPAVVVIPLATARTQTQEGAKAEAQPARLTTHAATLTSANAVKEAVIAALDNYSGKLGGVTGVQCEIWVTSTWPTPDIRAGRWLYVVDVEIWRAL